MTFVTTFHAVQFCAVLLVFLSPLCNTRFTFYQYATINNKNETQTRLDCGKSLWRNVHVALVLCLLMNKTKVMAISDIHDEFRKLVRLYLRTFH